MEVAKRTHAVARVDEEIGGGGVDGVVGGLAHNHRTRKTGRDGLRHKLVRFDHREVYCGRQRGGTPVGGLGLGGDRKAMGSGEWGQGCCDSGRMSGLGPCEGERRESQEIS